MRQKPYFQILIAGYKYCTMLYLPIPKVSRKLGVS